jgi:hypothetical protein
VDGCEPLVADADLAEGGIEALEVALHDRRGHDTLHPRRIARMNKIRRQRQDDCDRGDAGRPGADHERPASVWLHVRGIDHDELAGGEATNDLAMKDRERRPRPALIRFVTAEQRAIRIG